MQMNIVILCNKYCLHQLFVHKIMSLNRDVLYLIFEELQYDKNQYIKNTLYSCLLVNRTWCETAIPILWNNPYCRTDNAKKKLLNVILLHLSEESRDILKNQRINILSEEFKRPLFNYISFCRYLRLYELDKMIVFKQNIKSSKIIREIILKLFINKNTNKISQRQKKTTKKKINIHYKKKKKKPKTKTNF